MKQEQKLVAEIYRYMAPFIDTTCEIYLSLDGQAALDGVNKGHFFDGTIPDLWFTIIGQNKPILIEAKAQDMKGSVLLMRSQLLAWCSEGTGKHKPQLWVATNNSFDKFFLWQHQDFVEKLDKSKNKQKTVTITLPKVRNEFKSITELALSILCKTQQLHD